MSIANPIEGLQDWPALVQLAVMRATWVILAITLALPLLAACQLALPGRPEEAGVKANPITGGNVAVTPLDAPAAAPQPPKPAAPDPAPQATATPPEVPSVPVSPEALECLSNGGTWGRVADTTAYSCFRQTRDAGKSCRRQTDCETECLARSRTCAPITPLFGCNPVLQADGREVNLCID